MKIIVIGKYFSCNFARKILLTEMKRHIKRRVNINPFDIAMPNKNEN